MKVKYSPQVSSNQVTYTFNNDKITCNCNGEVDVFDFSNVPAGSLVEVESSLPIRVIQSVKRTGDGVLWVELYRPISSNSSSEERFPDWVEV